MNKGNIKNWLLSVYGRIFGKSWVSEFPDDSVPVVKAQKYVKIPPKSIEDNHPQPPEIFFWLLLWGVC